MCDCGPGDRKVLWTDNLLFTSLCIQCTRAFRIKKKLTFPIMCDCGSGHRKVSWIDNSLFTSLCVQCTRVFRIKKTHLSYNVRVISVADIDLHGNTVILQLHINIPLLFVRNNLSVENS